jgi:hypothetical protein
MAEEPERIDASHIFYDLTGVEPGGEVINLVYNDSTKTLVLNVRYASEDGKLGRLYVRRIKEEKYVSLTPINSSSRSSFTEAICAPNSSLVHCSATLWSGKRGRWRSIYRIDLESFASEEVLTQSAVHIPKPYDSFSIVRLLNASSDGQTLDCTVSFWTRGEVVGYFLAKVDLLSRRFDILTKLKAVFY